MAFLISAVIESVQVAVGHVRAMTTRNRIYLIGFSGAGKSAVGRSTARLLGWRFEDADERIVERAGKPVERVFAEDGEPAFRELERATIAEFAREEHRRRFDGEQGRSCTTSRSAGC